MLATFPDFSDGALYEPSGERETNIIVNLLKIKPNQRAVDLGSGDGRLVIAMAQKGALAFGFEKEKALVKQSLKKIKEIGLKNTAFIHHCNFWEKDLSIFQKIAVFQYYTVMDRLERKLLKELSYGAYVVSHHWTFPRWQPVKQIEDIYLYIKH